MWDPVGIDRWEESSTWVSEVLVLFWTIKSRLLSGAAVLNESIKKWLQDNKMWIVPGNLRLQLFVAAIMVSPELLGFSEKAINYSYIYMSIIIIYANQRFHSRVTIKN